MRGADYQNGQSGRGGDFVVGLLCGTAVGTAVGLLLATKTGAELRGELADSAERIRRRVGETYDKASEAVGHAVDTGREAVRQGRQTFDDVKADFTAEVQNRRTDPERSTY